MIAPWFELAPAHHGPDGYITRVGAKRLPRVAVWLARHRFEWLVMDLTARASTPGMKGAGVGTTLDGLVPAC